MFRHDSNFQFKSLATRTAIYSAEYIHQIYFNCVDKDDNGCISVYEVFIDKNDDQEINTFMNLKVYEDTDYVEACNQFDIDSDHKVFCGHLNQRVSTGQTLTMEAWQMCTFQEVYISGNQTCEGIVNFGEFTVLPQDTEVET